MFVIRIEGIGTIKFITKTCPCNKQILFERKNCRFPLKKNGIFLIFTQNIDCEYPQSMSWSKNKKKISIPLHTPVLLYKSGIKGGA